MINLKEEIIDLLINDYLEYLSDFTVAELKLVKKYNVFTLREAKKLKEQYEQGE